MSALPDRALTHTCSLLVHWPLVLSEIWCFPQPMDWDHFSLCSCLQSRVSGSWCLLWRPMLPMCEELIYEYKTMLVPGDHVQPLESTGTPLMAREHSDPDLMWFNCMHAFHYKSWPKASRRGRPGNQTILHGLLKSRFVLCQHKQFNLMFSLLSKHWVLHLNPLWGEECFLFISKCTSMSESLSFIPNE